MQLASLLSPKLIFLRRSYAGKDAMIDELIHEVFQTRYKIMLSEEQVRTAVHERENFGGTVFPSGLAVPHARLENFNDILLVICVPESPVLLDEGKQIRLMVMVLTGHESSAIYLNVLSSFVKLSIDKEYFGRLITAPSPQKFIQIIKERNIEAKKEILVESIMTKEFHTLRLENTVKDAIDFFYKNKTGYIPILDEDDAFVGELSIFDIFEIGIPTYAKQIGNLKFMKSFEAFENLLDKENSTKIREVMKKYTDTLEEDSPIFEAIMKITQTQKRNIPVVRKGKELVGIVSFMDIIHKVLRA